MHNFYFPIIQYPTHSKIIKPLTQSSWISLRHSILFPMRNYSTNFGLWTSPDLYGFGSNHIYPVEFIMCLLMVPHQVFFLSSRACPKEVLGPLLFLIYINDLPESIPYSSVYLFADDTKLIKSSNQFYDDNLLQVDVYSMLSWCLRWKL